MKTQDLKDGMLLVLTSDVPNPHPDRRKKYSFRDQTVWQKGTKFTVVIFPAKTYTYANGRSDTLPAELALEPHTQWSALNRFHENKDPDSAYNRVLAHLEPTDENVDSIMVRADAKNWGYEHVVRVLLSQGRISLDDVRQALAVETDEN